MRSDAYALASSGHGLAQLMAGYQQADRAALTDLVERLSPQLYRFFASQTDSRADAEDMLQDAWRRIHRSRHTYRPGEPVLPWLYAIARCARADNHRKCRHVASRETGVGVSHASSLQRNETSILQRFEELAAGLPVAQREVLTMLTVNRLNVEEVARATSSTAGAVRRRMHRAYQRLRKLLEPSAAPQISMP